MTGVGRRRFLLGSAALATAAMVPTPAVSEVAHGWIYDGSTWVHHYRVRAVGADWVQTLSGYFRNADEAIARMHLLDEPRLLTWTRGESKLQEAAQ